MHRFKAIFRKCGQIAPILSPIAVISGNNYWRRRNGVQNGENEWTNTRLWPEFTLRTTRLNGTEVRDNYSEWQHSIVQVTDTDTKTISYGSGFVVDSRGYVVTTALGVQGVSTVSLALSIGVETHKLIAGARNDPNAFTHFLTGQVVYADPDVGLALIKVFHVKPGALPVLPTVGADEQTKSGQRVVVLGTPTQKRGFVSGTIACANGPPVGTGMGHRYNDQLLLNPSRQYMSHNIISVADYNGGPVLDMKGKVVGVMLSAKHNDQYIVSANDLREFIDRGLAYEPNGRRNRYSIAGKNRLGVMLKCDGKGFHVCKFTDNNSNNSALGLELHDTITAVNGNPLKILAQLTDAIDALTTGHTLKLTVLRTGRPTDIEVVAKSFEFSVI